MVVSNPAFVIPRPKELAPAKAGAEESLLVSVYRLARLGEKPAIPVNEYRTNKRISSPDALIRLFVVPFVDRNLLSSKGYETTSQQSQFYLGLNESDHLKPVSPGPSLLQQA